MQINIDLLSDFDYTTKSYEEKILFFRADEYFSQFSADVEMAAQYHSRNLYANCKQKATEVAVHAYECAITYAKYVCDSKLPDFALEEVINEIRNEYYLDTCSEELICPRKINRSIHNEITEVGAAIEAMCAIICYDKLANKDERLMMKFYNLREWIKGRTKPYPSHVHWNLWTLIAERIPDNKYPSEGELRLKIKTLEAENNQLKQELLSLKNILPGADIETDEVMGEERFPNRIIVGYLLSLMGIKSKDDVKNQAALKRALHGLTGVAYTSVSNYLEDFKLCLQYNSKAFERLNNELSDAGLAKFHIELKDE